METFITTNGLRGRKPEITNLNSPTKNRPLEEIGQPNEERSFTVPTAMEISFDPGTPQPQETNVEHKPDLAEPSAKTSLLNEVESSSQAVNHLSSPARWNALGLFNISILFIGTIGLSVAVSLLSYIWKSSMRAQAGHSDNGQLWNLIVWSDRTSVTVTVTAAIIRVCLGFQTGIYTAMIASLLIERTGLPLRSAPLISILRAVQTSPHNLVSVTTMKTPFAIAIYLGVLLTGVSQLASTALLIDFQNTNITAPQQTVSLLYGSSEPDEAFGPSKDRDLAGNSGVNSLNGSKIWNSQPNTYFRFAEHVAPIPDVDFDKVDDSGTILRAILPFTNVADRTNLREYDGPSVVFDSRVVCVRPRFHTPYSDDITVSFSAVISRTQSNKRGNGRPSRFDDLIVSGTFYIPTDPLLFNDDYEPVYWPFKCIVPAPKAAEEAIYSPISICSAVGGVSAKDLQFTKLPKLLATVLPSPPYYKSNTFLVFNTTGSIGDWRRYLLKNEDVENADTEEYRASQTADKLNWTLSYDGIWVHLRPPPGSVNASVSISTCLTSLPGMYQNVSMSSDRNGLEPSLSWDRDKTQYQTAFIRDQYLNRGNNQTSRDFAGILDLRPKTSWELPDGLHAENMTLNESLNYWMLFNSVAGGLPYMNLNGVREHYEVLAGGILLPGAFSPYAVHFAHAALFQDILKTTGSLSQGLQGLFTVLRQMAYYESSPYFKNESTAIITLSTEKLIPTRWTGFIVVAVTIAAHLILLTIITVLFLGWTKASWLGNVWASLSQVVSSETEDLIDKSTDKNDRAVEKIIMAGTSGAGGKLTYRVRVKRNEVNGRNELSLI